MALVALLLSAATAGAEGRPPYGGRPIAALPSAPASLDPLQAQTPADVALVGLIYDTIYARDGLGHVVPQLAAGPPLWAPSQLEVRIPLRIGVRFSDGRLLRPADVAASLKRAQTTLRTAWALAPVASIASVENQLVIKLNRPTPDLPALLALPQLAITPSGLPPAKLPIGSGPFSIKRFTVQNRRIELEAHGNHFAGRPYLDGLVLRWFEDPEDEPRGYEAGEADLSLRGAVAFAGHEPKYPTVVHEGSATGLTYIGFGTLHPVTTEPRFRRALALALGRGAFRHVGSGERIVPTGSPLSVDLGGPAMNELAARDGQARGLLAPLGLRVPLELICDRSRPDDAEVATRIVAGLDRVGIAVTYSALAPVEYGRRAATGQFDLLVGQLAAPAPEPMAQLAAAFAAGNDDWLVERLRTGPVGLDTAVAAFEARLPIVPLFHRTQRAHSKKVLRGLGFDILGRIDWADAYFWTGPELPSELP